MTEIIAVCGVDGCGKSSLIKRYAEHHPELATCHKTTNACVQLTQSFHQRSSDLKADWLSGSYALSIGAGAMFDFLSYYRHQIEPLLADDTHRHLLCDRYTYCFLAYLAGTGHDKYFDQLFAKVKPACHVIHVDVDFDLLSERYAKREEKNEDEFVELMVAFREGYRIVYERLGVTPTFITNNADFDSAYQSFASAVDQLRAD